MNKFCVFFTKWKKILYARRFDFCNRLNRQLKLYWAVIQTFKLLLLRSHNFGFGYFRLSFSLLLQHLLTILLHTFHFFFSSSSSFFPIAEHKHMRNMLGAQVFENDREILTTSSVLFYESVFFCLIALWRLVWNASSLFSRIRRRKSSLTHVVSLMSKIGEINYESQLFFPSFLLFEQTIPRNFICSRCNTILYIFSAFDLFSCWCETESFNFFTRFLYSRTLLCGPSNRMTKRE